MELKYPESKTMKYRKKPVVIEAIRFDGSTHSVEKIKDWSDHLIEFYGAERVNQTIYPPFLIIPTLEGNMTASVNDWIIKGISGEFYPCKPDIFEATYELVEDL